MPPKRMTANPVKPGRHRPGKATGPDDSSDSDSEGSHSDREKESKRAIPPPPKAASAGRIISSGSLGKLNLDQRKQEAEAKEKARIAREKAERKAAEEGFVTEEEEDDDDDDDDDDDESGSGEDDSSEEESSSEDERPKRLMLRPKFIPKNQRAAATGTSASSSAQAARDEEARQAAEEARRKAEADALVEEQIKKDLAARTSGRRKHWEDFTPGGGGDGEDGAGSGDSDVDTTDGLDPEAEEAAWRLRELKRLKRERDRMMEREAEIAERERRDALTQEERDAEDAEKLARQQEDKDAKGKMSYMQKYFHKGAFYGEEMQKAGLDNRDIMGMRIADDVRDRTALPEYLQKRDMTKLGRKGASKYKDLKSEDTGRWGEFRDHRPDRDGFGKYGDVDERFRPDDDRGFRRGGEGGDRGAKGANAIPLGERKDAQKDRGHKEGRDRDGGGDSYRPGGGERDTSRHRRRRTSGSRSRSPRRRRESREDRDRRKRSASRDRGRPQDSDKRRRLEVE